MTTPHAWSLVLWGRFRCRLRGRHLAPVRIAHHECEVLWCPGCWDWTVRPLPDLLPTAIDGCYVSRRSAAEILAGLEQEA